MGRRGGCAKRKAQGACLERRYRWLLFALSFFTDRSKYLFLAFSFRCAALTLPLRTAAPESSVPGARPGDTAMPGQTATKTVEHP